MLDPTLLRAWSRRGLAFVRSRPWGYVFLVCARAWHFVRPWVAPAAYGWPACIASALMWGSLFVFGAVGFARLWRRRRAAALALGAIALGPLLAHALTHVMVRHRVPVLDTLAVVCAAPVIAGWLARARERLLARVPERG